MSKPTTSPLTERPTARVFMSGRSQAVRLPQEFRFECEEVAIRRHGRHIILSPRFADWKELWAHMERGDGTFGAHILKRRAGARHSKRERLR